MIYGIETIGTRKIRYCIKEITRTGTNPVDFKTYRTETDALEAAAALGLDVIAVGDLWKLLRAADTVSR